ncbi:MAG: hypothetical protein Q9163_006089 [Psora crenata]
MPPFTPSPRNYPRWRRPSKQNEASDPNAVTRIREVGSGGNGRCYLVRRLRDQMLLVQKVNANSETTMREREILEHVLPRHRRIIRLEFESESPWDGNLLFQYCPCGDLQALIESFKKQARRFPELFVWHVFHKLAEALAFIHFGYNKSQSRNLPANWREVVHRDLKPHNVFLRTPYSDEPPCASILLGDFGSATLRHQSDCFTTVMYQPPELPICTAKGDVWGLGAIIHSLVHGHGPFTTPSEWQRRIYGGMLGWAQNPQSHQPQEVPTMYSADVNEFMMGTLAFAVRNRPTSLELLQRLEQRGKA